MNEPYNRVHVQEDSNSTIGTIGTHIGLGMATSAAMEAGSAMGAKHINNPSTKEFFNQMSYHRPDPNSGFLNRTFNHGMSTGRGRLMNYGGAAAGGLLTGMISANRDE